jgi:hypothetical protein
MFVSIQKLFAKIGVLVSSWEVLCGRNHAPGIWKLSSDLGRLALNIVQIVDR